MPTDDNNTEEVVEEKKGLSPEQLAEWGAEGNQIDEKGMFGQKVEEPAPEPDPVPETPEEEEEDAPEAPRENLVDPGEFKPQDYAFEVTVYDEEGKNGKPKKIKSVDEWDALLDTDPNLGSAASLLKAQRLATKMETSLERDQSDWQKKKTEFEEGTRAAEVAQEAVTQMANEITYLVSKGDLPQVAKQYQNADWSDPEVAKQDGVKEQLAVLNYMRKENAARAKANLKPMTSILDAFNAFQIEQSRKQAITNKTNAGQARKEASARVAGSTPAPVSVAPKGIMVGRGGSLRDMTTTDWTV